MSLLRVFQWRCQGAGCEVLFNEKDHMPNRRFCRKCIKKKIALAARKRYVPRKQATQADHMLYALKNHLCNIGMLAAYLGMETSQASTVLYLLKKKHVITKRNGFYYYGGLR